MREETIRLYLEQWNQNLFNSKTYRQAQKHWDAIAKPIHGLGILEEIIAKIAGLTANVDVSFNKKCVLVFCADNGIVEEGVTQTDSSVTAIVAANMANGTASINRMAKAANTEVKVIDVGIRDQVKSDQILARTIRRGTRNFLKEPAMTKEEALEAIKIGMEAVRQCKKEGYQIIATGEMGIGNTTTSSALISAYLGIHPEKLTGRGAGLSDAGLEKKKTVIVQALKKYGWMDQKIEDGETAFRVLCEVGGLDIAALAGVFLAGAIEQIPIVIDGVISAAAALTAYRLCPYSVNAMIASHSSKEQAQQAVMEELGLAPILYGNLALGEGTGAVLLFPMLDMALEVYRENATFEQTKIAAYQNYERNAKKP